MSVTQNYKTFKLSASDDAIQYIVIAVMQRFFAEQDRLKSAESPALVNFLRRDIAVGSEAIAALNCTSTREDTHGALEGDMLDLVIQLLRNEMVELRGQERGMRSSKISCDVVATKIERVNAALLFLENPK